MMISRLNSLVRLLMHHNLEPEGGIPPAQPWPETNRDMIFVGMEILVLTLPGLSHFFRNIF